MFKTSRAQAHLIKDDDEGAVELREVLAKEGVLEAKIEEGEDLDSANDVVSLVPVSVSAGI